MKRDLELVRTILLAVESRQPPEFGRRLSIESVDDDLVSDHVEILREGGYLHAQKTNDALGRGWCRIRLTWSGHDYLDAVRDHGTWEKTKGLLAKAGGSAALEVVKAIAGEVARRALFG